MNETIAIIECIVTIVSLGISLVALVGSYRQVKLSNKQNLFNSRVESYLIFIGLIKLFESNRQLIDGEKEDDIYYSCDFVLNCLINNSYLENMGGAISKPLQQPEQKAFLRKIDELKNEALKMKYIFYGESSELLSRFIDLYAEILMKLYQYIVLMNSMRKRQEEIPKKKSIKEVAKEVNEIEYREDLFNHFREITNVYNEIKSKNILLNAEKQIKL